MSKVKAGSTYFDDGVRKIDFVLAYSKKKSDEDMQVLNLYLENLARTGVEIEKANGLTRANKIFVKLHAPDKLLLHVANIHNIILSCQNNRNVPKFRKRWKFFLNAVLKPPNPYNPMFQRTTDIVKGQRTSVITSAERILLITMLLNGTKFGQSHSEYGFRKLLGKRILVAAYPIHDGDWVWSETGPLNDRQILGRFWANNASWYKYQPIHIIHQYFGPEVGFYFTWLGFYTQALILPAIIGIIIFLYGVTTCRQIDAPRVEEVCRSTAIMCPECPFKHCEPRKLQKTCRLAKIAYVFDNWLTAAFAMLTSFWAATVYELWKRKEAKCLFRWNQMTAGDDFEVLPEYGEKTKYRRISPQNGKFEPYVPTKIKMWHYCISTVVCFLMILVVLLGVVAVIIVRHVVGQLFSLMKNEFIQRNETLILLMLCAILNVLIIKLLEPCLNKVSLILTRMENPRTQTEFNNSLIFKRYFLAFCNNYCPLFYLAFIKENIFRHPGEMSQYTELFGIRAGACHPSGCIIALSVQMIFLMLLKSFAGKIISYIMAIWHRYIRKPKKGDSLDMFDIPQWEIDYGLEPIDDFYLINDFLGLVLQYGFVTFFVAAMPLAPLFALLNNVVELRLDAQKFLKGARRTIPRTLAGLGAWNGILIANTYMGAFCNAFVVSFTTEFVPRELYRYRNGNLIGFVNYTLSEYQLAVNDTSKCFYRGRRNEDFSLTEDFYYDLAMKFAAVVIFEHIIFVVTGILLYAIPDVPFSIRKKLSVEDRQLQEMRLKSLHNKGQ